MNKQVRMMTLAMIATIAISANAQSTRKPSGNITAKSAPTQTVTPATAPKKVVLPPPDPSEQAKTADEVRQDELSPAAIEAAKAQAQTAVEPTEAPVEATVAPVTAPTVTMPPIEMPTLATRPTDSNILLPVGTAIRMKLDSTISTRDSKPGETFSGKVSEDVVVEGKTVIPTGATLSGRVTRLFEPRRIAGRPAIQLVPDSVVMPNGKSLAISAVIVDTGDPKRLNVNEEGRIKGSGITQRDKVELVAGTAAGTIVGSVIKLGTGTWVGAAAGATFVTARWALRRHTLELPAGTELIMEISNPVEATVFPTAKTAQGSE